MKTYKFFLIVFFAALIVVSGNFLKANALNGKSTEAIHQAQVEKDDEILAKDFKDMTPEEFKRYRQIQKSQELKRSGYEKRAIKKLSNNQPKTFDEYEKMSSDIKTQDLKDFNPQFKKDPRYSKVPNPEFQVVRYNYPAGSREINLSSLKTTRHVNSQGVLSPDEKFVAYTDVDYNVGLHSTSSNLNIIPVTSIDIKTQKRQKELLDKENKLYQMTQEFEKNKTWSSTEKKLKKEELKKFREEVQKLRQENYAQDKQDALAAQNDTPAQKKAKALLQAHVKDKIKESVLSTGLYDTDYGVQRTLTIVDWSEDSNKILIKEKIAQEKDGLWQTNIWVYDHSAKEVKKLDEVRQAVEYYWNKDRIVDLHYYRFDLYPLGWDAQRPDKILLYVYGYNKQSGQSPKFLGTWSIDSKGEKSQLISVQKTGYIIQANGFCLKTKNLEFYE